MRQTDSRTSQVSQGKVINFLIVIFCVLGSMVTVPALGQSQQAHGEGLLLRAAAEDLSILAARYDLEVKRQVRDDLWDVEATEATDLDGLVAAMAGDLQVDAVERAALAALPSDVAPAYAETTLWQDIGAVGRSSAACGSDAEAWNGYADQTASRLVAMRDAQRKSVTCGAVTVAVIDTGIDLGHPVLQGVLVPGYDFLLESATASEWRALDQSTQAILEESLRAINDQSTQAILEGHGVGLGVTGSSMVPILAADQTSEVDGNDLPPFFGHGTMVAGLIHMVAPEARIMPLRTFDGHGMASVNDVVAAIYYAVDHGAQVINMSFSMADVSIELRRAVQYARDRGVVSVSSAGNGGEQTLTYPAALPSVLGVASTELDDTLSEFSNYGNALVDLAAPGAEVISTYPGGLFAAGWGTSFSAPLVSGTVALLYDGLDGEGRMQRQARQALRAGSDHIPELGGQIGSGRLDAWASVDAAD